MRMPGMGHGGGCKCVVERKAQPTDEEMLEYLVKKRKLNDTQKLDVFLDALNTTREKVTRDIHTQPLDQDESSGEESV